MKKPQLFVDVEGEGRPIILLHGLASTHRYWQDVRKELREKGRLILPDLLGFGNSPKPSARYSMEEHLELLEQAVRPLASSPYILVGHSMAAVIALQWVVQRPDWFSKVVLTSLPFLNERDIHQQVASMISSRKFAGRRPVAKLLLKLLGWGGWLPGRIPALFPHNLPKHVIEDIFRHRPLALKRTMENAIFAEAVVADLRQVTVPVHIILSDNDKMVKDSRLYLEKIEAENPNVTHEYIKTSHQIPLDAPKVVARAILSV